MPTFIIKDIADWKDAPQRVTTFPIELHDANGERRFVSFTRGWLQRFRPMVDGYITFRGAEPWQSSMAGYSPMAPDVLSVWPIDEKVSDPAPEPEAQDSPNRAEIVIPTPHLTGIDGFDADGNAVASEGYGVVYPNAEAIDKAIKAAHRPLEKTPSQLADPIARSVDALVKGGELGQRYAPEPVDTTTVAELRAEVAALKANLDSCAKARDRANVDATLARQAQERAASLEKLHNALIEKHADLNRAHDELYDRLKNQANYSNTIIEERDTAQMRVEELELELADLRANAEAYFALDNDRSINDMARESAIERLTMSTALGLTREQLETTEAGMLEQLATWEANEELRKLREYGQTVRYFGASQHTEKESPDLNALLDQSPDRIKAREQAPEILKGAGPYKPGHFAAEVERRSREAWRAFYTDPAPTVPGINPVHDEPAQDKPTSAIETQVKNIEWAIGELVDVQREQDTEHGEGIAKLNKRLKKLRKQLRAAGVL